MDGLSVQVAEVHPHCEVLGPGDRFVVWVQGCGIVCDGCTSPSWIPFEGGAPVAVADLAARVAGEAVDGLTLSGGEPFAQADALADLVSAVREHRDLSVMSYTGYTREHLERHGTRGQRRLLGLLDLLVDGPYLRSRHGDLRWRGSANQRIHVLTPRHADVAGLPDTSVGLQFEIDRAGSVRWLGVPVVPSFRDDFEKALNLVPVAAKEAHR